MQITSYEGYNLHKNTFFFNSPIIFYLLLSLFSRDKDMSLYNFINVID